MATHDSSPENNPGSDLPYSKELIEDYLKRTKFGRIPYTGIHPKPLLYKYYWWVITESGAPEDAPKARAFRSIKSYSIAREAYFVRRQADRMCTYEAMEYKRELDEKKTPYEIYRQELPRIGPGSPFDTNKKKWKDYELAPSYDEDTDPIWNGYK